MKRSLAIAVALGVLGVPAAARAQAPGPYAFSTYYGCDQNRESFTDPLQEHVFGPRLDAHVKAGHLLSWGWLSHRIGGAWRRAEYMIAPDRATLLKVRSELFEEIQGDAELQSSRRVLNDICPDHDDYIFRVAASSNPEAVAQKRPSIGLTVYFECNAAREAKTDEILTKTFAPILNRHVGEGALSSWIWLAHDTGGKIRRALAFDAADGPTLYAARDAFEADLQSQAGKELAEFEDICASHVDYLWDITLSRP
ncbi:MAG: hypothetical protein ACE5HQ_10860 [Gemmatimonadota bacterium]